jgi:hypothetical protein
MADAKLMLRSSWKRGTGALGAYRLSNHTTSSLASLSLVHTIASSQYSRLSKGSQHSTTTTMENKEVDTLPFLLNAVLTGCSSSSKIQTRG